MICPSCGKEIKENEKFCGCCGYNVSKPKEQNTQKENVKQVNKFQTVHKIDKNEKIEVPNFFEKKAIERQIKINERKDFKKKQKDEKKALQKKQRKETHFYLKLFVAVFAILAVAVGAVYVIIHFQIVQPPFSFYTVDRQHDFETIDDSKYKYKDKNNNNNNNKKAVVETVDAEKLLNESGNVISKINAKESKATQTEKEIYKIFNDKGFYNNISYCYDMNGNFYENIASKNSSTKHPTYRTSISTDDASTWTIQSINGVITASPNSYNLNSEKTVIFCENDACMSYDSATNQFFELVPSAFILIKLDKIDYEVLNNLTNDKIEELL